jgi:hydrogenase 3 maturation protease
MKRLLLGVGNSLCADDGVGPAVARRLQGAAGWMSVDCGISLENASGVVTNERPDLLVVVDAARMGLSPGSVRRLPCALNDRMLASTHGLPLSFILSRMQDAAGEVVLVGVEPETVELGQEISATVSEAGDRLVSILRSADLASVRWLGEEDEG